MDRATSLEGKQPHLTIDLVLYPTDQGGRAIEAVPGWGFVCVQDEATRAGWDGWPLLGKRSIRPGESRRVGLFLLSGDEAASSLRSARRFFIWEGRVVGEATVVEADR